jgi:hypothetical protein
MSAMPARVTEAPRGARPIASPPRTQRRVELRAARKEERRTRRRWAIFGCAILGSSFVLTVGILDVLH